MPLDRNEKHAFDQTQFQLAQAQDDIKRLTARVTALEAGTPLPPDGVPDIQPTLPAPEKITCAPEHFIAPVTPQPEVVPDITVGWAGGQRQ
jgi:hypothetical protein